MKTELRDDDGCTIVLHPNDDGTYHWMCPNCKREDLGLSAETDLTAYCPSVTCPGCGFQFGVDKRYLSTQPETVHDRCVAVVEKFRQRIQYESDEGVRESLFGDMVIELESLR